MLPLVINPRVRVNDHRRSPTKTHKIENLEYEFNFTGNLSPVFDCGLIIKVKCSKSKGKMWKKYLVVL